MGVMYHHGQGVPGDDQEAIKQYRKAAKNGLAEAQSNLGDLYYYGVAVHQDYQEAMKWYEMEAEQGDADAQASLGWMYGNGDGVQVDTIQSYFWFSLAAAQIECAKEARDSLVEGMTAEQIIEAECLYTSFFAGQLPVAETR